MAAPVWVLSVDLQTKTATFQTGMAEAARSARSAFGEISSGAGEMGGAVGKHSVDVRHSLGLVDNVIRGAHSQAMADLIRMYSQSALVMGALPLAATAGGIALIAGIAVEAVGKFKEWRLEAEKIQTDFTNLGTAGNTAFADLDAKILQAQQRADELRNNHLAALRDQIGLIDHATLADLVHSFEEVEKAADTVLQDLQAKWYNLGEGSAGAKHALDQFKTQYESLLAQGRDKDASDLLGGTLSSAEKVVTAISQVQQAWDKPGPGSYAMFEGAKDVLDRAGVSYATTSALEKEKSAQEALVQVLKDQVGVEDRLNVLKKLQADNATGEAGQQSGGRASARAREAADSAASIAEAQLSAQKAGTEAALTMQEAGVAAREAVEISFSNRLYAIRQQQLQADITALDTSKADYLNQLKALQDKETELTATHTAEITAIEARGRVAAYQQDLQALEENIREQINATQQGTAARVAAIDVGIREEQAQGLQQTAFYRALLTARVEAARQAGEEEAKVSEATARAEADNIQKMGDITVAALRQKLALEDSARRVTREREIAEATQLANAEYAVKMAALDKELAGLDQNGKEYLTKLQQLQNKEKQTVQAHEDELTAIKEKAEMQRNQRVLAAETQFEGAIARSLTQSIMGHQTWAQMLLSLGDQVVSGMIENALKDMMADDMTRERDAASAARKAFIAGMHLPFPANIVAAPVLAAGAFASVMAFNTGTDMVPGVGRGDVVPALLSPGEGVVPGGVMDGLRNVARNGGFSGGNAPITVHVRPTYNVQTISGDGMQKALEKHSDQLEKQFRNVVRKMNR